MNSKLTLSIEKSVVEKAKSYAKNSKRSLSEIIQTYLEKITSDVDDYEDQELNSIRGAISLKDDFNLKEDIRRIRIKKHLTK